MTLSGKNLMHVIIVDGIIGAGKSTFISQFLVPFLKESGFNVATVNEPVEKWKENGDLQQFYSDPVRRGFQFQIRVLVDRLNEAQKVLAENPNADYFVCERSIYTDILFLELLYDTGSIDKSEYNAYMDLWKLMEKTYVLTPTMFIYLRPDLPVCMERVRGRSRTGEECISEDYQFRLNVLHDKFFGSEEVTMGNRICPVKCVVLKTNGDYRSKNVQQEWLKEMNTNSW